MNSKKKEPVDTAGSHSPRRANLLRSRLALTLTALALACPSLVWAASAKQEPQDLTPFGRYPHRCISQVKPTDQIMADGSVRDHKGVRHKPAQGCPPLPSASGGGWIISASTPYDASPLQFFQAGWTVPANPASNDGQVLFFFPGAESPGYQIVQPVLTWSNGQWTAAAWNCCAPQAYKSTPIVVNPGDVITGSGQLNSDGTWSVSISDFTIGLGFNDLHTYTTSLSHTPVTGLATWGFGGVLEAYGISQCADYPASDGVSFTDLEFQDADGFWLAQDDFNQANVDTSDTIPACDYGVSSQPPDLLGAGGTPIPIRDHLPMETLEWSAD